ncbi:Uncharacterised protein [Salmonella enterica subsp. enterica serovar Bovismorbificans]|nr:Uncharacterised protein [Salmonella enterica subsp. enterica serovar Bovismorbificans]
MLLLCEGRVTKVAVNDVARNGKEKGPDIRPFFFAVAGYVIYRYLSHTLFTS